VGFGVHCFLNILKEFTLCHIECLNHISFVKMFSSKRRKTSNVISEREQGENSYGSFQTTFSGNIQEYLAIDPEGKCPARSFSSLVLFIIAAICVLLSHSIQSPLLSIAKGDKESYTFKPQNLIYSCQLVIAIVLVFRFKISGQNIFSLKHRFQGNMILYLFFIRGIILLVHLSHIYALQFTPVPLLQGLGYTEIVWVILLRHLFAFQLPADNASLAVISIMILTGLYTTELCGDYTEPVSTKMLLFSFGNPFFMGLAQFLTYTILQTGNIRAVFDNAALLSLIDLFWAICMSGGKIIPFQGMTTFLSWGVFATYFAMYMAADFLTISQSPEVFITLKYFGNMISVLLTVNYVKGWQRTGLLVVICLTCVSYRLNEKKRVSLKEMEDRFKHLGLLHP